MNNLRYYAFYGTLRKGMENHAIYAAQLRYMDTVSLPGFTMHSLTEYPYAVRSDTQHSIIADLYEIMDLETEQMINAMELEADYILSTVPVGNTIFGIFLFREAVVDGRLVAHGDWCRYCREAAF